MSDLLRIGFVVEGPTDYWILRELAVRFLGGRDFVPSRIQPPEHDILSGSGRLGGGWKGVLAWCGLESAGHEGIHSGLAYANHDLLLVHVDADIAGESELADLGLSHPCPPASDTCDAIRRHLAGLLRAAPLPPKVVLCVPAQCLEAWVVSVLHPAVADRHAPIECRREPECLLIGRPERLVRRKGHSLDKHVVRYRAHAPAIADRWLGAVARCSEAERFEREFRAAV